MGDLQLAERPAVFLDRDGTLIEEVGYLNRLERVRFFPWSVDAVRVLNMAGFAVVIVTNQSGVAQGYFDEAFVRQAHAHIDARLRAGGARIDAYYYCPHHPQARVEAYRVACECRKPKAGMVRQAERDLGIDPLRSFVVGDRWGDVELAHAAGARGVLVKCGYAHEDEERPTKPVTADAVAENLMEAAAWIIRASREPRGTDSPGGLPTE